MSRKAILTFAAAATVAAAGLASGSTYATGFVGGRAFGGATLTRVNTGRGPGHPIGRVLIPRGPGHPSHVGVVCILGRPCHPTPPGPPIWWGWHHHHHHHHHWVFRGGRWIVDDVVEEAPAIVSVPAPVASTCGCLTKTYTPTGLVVFADVCTRESASAPANDDAADASQAPTTPVPATATPISQVPTTPNYAGRTYEDYLAANPQFALPQVSSQAPAQTPDAPKQN